jgi:hypothetical protein
MNPTLSTPAQWAQQEFALARLGDQRRTQRLVKIASRLAQSPGGTLPQALPEWAELKAAYRFFSQPKVGLVEVQTAHWERTRQRCREPGEYLLIEDTTELDYTGQAATEELGPIGNGGGRGLLLHTTLAVRVESWTRKQRPEGIAQGLFFQQCWARSGPPKRGRETWRQRMKRARESQRWTLALDQTGRPPPDSHWIFLADREADFYEPIEHCQGRGVDFIIRACRDRAQADAPEHLKAAAQLPVRGQMNVELRARPGQAARTATVQVRSGRLTFKGPERRGDPKQAFTVNVVEASQINVPSGAAALHWTLLTSLPCEDWGDADSGTAANAGPHRRDATFPNRSGQPHDEKSRAPRRGLPRARLRGRQAPFSGHHRGDEHRRRSRPTGPGRASRQSGVATHASRRGR